MSRKTILVVSDIHYACEAEQQRHDHELRVIKNWFARTFVRLYRDYFWLRNPTGHNHLLDQFFQRAPAADYVIANGDYSCNTAFVGILDDAACQSALECLGKLRGRFEPNFAAIFGDHELGKTSLFGNAGGTRLASWYRAKTDLGLKPFWKIELGRYVLIGVVSTLIALPVFSADLLPEEQTEWDKARGEHLNLIKLTFASLKPDQRVILFCHDPTALPFLLQETEVRQRISQIERTIIGHLHSGLFLWKSRVLAGMPVIRFLGKSVQRYSEALRRAREWKAFNISLCPSLHGIELLKDGGFLKLTFDSDHAGAGDAHVELIRIVR